MKRETRNANFGEKCRCGKERRSQRHRECVACHREYMRGYMAAKKTGEGAVKRVSKYSQESEFFGSSEYSQEDTWKPQIH